MNLDVTQTLTGKVRHLERTARAFESVPAQTNAVYVETGAHRGRSIGALVPRLMARCQALHLQGYDLFDMADHDSDLREQNGKGFGNLARCQAVCERLRKEYASMSFELIRGDTRATLGTTVATWVYIDGGHSYDTVKWDHQQLKNSQVTVFDDADLRGVNQYLWEIRHHFHIWDLEQMDGGRQAVIIKDPDNYDFEHAGLVPFQGLDPATWRSTR